MMDLQNLWNRRISEDVSVPELRTLLSTLYARRARRIARRAQVNIGLPGMCFYRDLYRQIP